MRNEIKIVRKRDQTKALIIFYVNYTSLVMKTISDDQQIRNNLERIFQNKKSIVY